MKLGDWRGHLFWAVGYALVGLAGYLFGLLVGRVLATPAAEIGALWCAIAGLATLQATRDETRKAMGSQLLGTLTGAVVSALYLSLWPFSVGGLGLCIGITVLLCRVWKYADNGRQAAVNVAVVMVISSLHPQFNAFTNAALRFLEACAGTGFALALMQVWIRVRPSAASAPPGH